MDWDFLFHCVKVFKSPVNAPVIGEQVAPSFILADKKIRESIYAAFTVDSVRQINWDFEPLMSVK